MKRIDLFIKKSGGLIACMALVAANLSMKQACFFLYHQPKVPDSLVKLKREK